MARLEAELSKAKAQTLRTKDTSPPRPDSRASTIFGVDRSHTPIGRANGTPVGRSDTPPQSSSVWDSMHAPPKQLYPNVGAAAPFVRKAAPTPSYRPPPSVASTYRTRSVVASPTPSTVSLTPTVDEDGWWS